MLRFLYGRPTCSPATVDSLGGVWCHPRARLEQTFLAVLVVAATFSPSLDAREPADAFLRELKARGYEDLALQYLDQLNGTGIAGESFQETIEYRRGELLIQAAMRQRDRSRQQEYLDQARRAFDEFVRDHADHPLALTARGRMGDILMERARLMMSQADQTANSPEQSSEFREKARRLFVEADRTFLKNKSRLRTRLEEIPKALSPESDAELIKERDLLRNEYVQSQFVAAIVRYELALTYDEGSRAREKQLQEAEKSFSLVAEKYRRRVAGLSAMLFQGRCRLLLKDPRRALSLFEDLLSLPDEEPILRALKAKALRGAVECWLDSEIVQYEAARQNLEAWLKTQRPTERSNDDWLMLKVLLAETYHQMITSDQAGREKTGLSREARRLAIDVAKYRGPAQERAQALLAELGLLTQTVAKTEPLASFDNAMAAARDALSQRQVASQTGTLLKGRLKAADDAASRAELEQRLRETDEQIQQAETHAIDMLRQAQDLVTDATPIEQINQARYYLCTLQYYRQDYFSAAVLADFLASRFPASDEGRRATAVSLASLVRLYGDGSSTWAPTLFHRMTDTAERIVRQWKGQPEADDALATLVTLAIQQRKIEAALAYLEQMSEDSPRRAAAEIAAGQAVWSLSMMGVQDGQDVTSPSRQHARAIKLIEQGFTRSADQPPSASTLSAALILGQHYVDTGKAQEAIELLEDAAVGPKTLADRGHPLLKSSNLRQRVYMLAIMAYVGALSEADSADDMVDRALSTLDQLTSSTPSDPDQQKQLSSTYVILARSLQQLIDAASPSRQTALIDAFSQLLERASATTRELSVLSWTADSFVRLGDAVTSAKPPAPGAETYYARAVETYQMILDRSAAGDLTVTVQERLLFETRQAVALRKQGKYATAVDRFASIVQQQPNQVYVQMEAARTLQAWGDAGNPEAYLKAMLGARPDANTNRNQIWGYGRIAKLIANKRSLSRLFFEARYGVAECRFKYALKGPEGERMKTLKQAETDIVMTARLYSDLGGEKSKVRYERLLQKIQRSMGKPPTGLSS